MLGVGLKRTPVSVAARLLPWTWGGFSVMFITGFLLICSEATRLYYNTAFRVKVVCLILAGLNVLRVLREAEKVSAQISKHE